MSRKRLKARDKITVKMSRDGMVEQNLTSGEDSRISKRTADFDLRGGQAESETFSRTGKRPESVPQSGSSQKPNHKYKQRHSRHNAVENGAAGATAEPQIVNMKSDALKQPENAAIPQSSDTAGQQNIRRDEYTRPVNNDGGGGVQQLLTGNKPKPPPMQAQNKTDMAEQSAPPQPFQQLTIERYDFKTVESEIIPHTDMRFDNGTAQTESEPQTALKHDKPESPLKTEPASELTFTRGEIPSKSLSRKKKKRRKRPAAKRNNIAEPTKQNADNPQQDRPQINRPETNITPMVYPKPAFPTADNTQPNMPVSDNQPLHDDTAYSKLNTEPNSQLHTEILSKLKFTSDGQPEPMIVKPKQNKQPSNENQQAVIEDSAVNNADAHPVTTEMEDIQQPTPDVADADGQQSETAAPKPIDTPDSALQTDESSQLKFEDDDAADIVPSRSEVKQQKRYGKAQAQADKSVEKLETAKSNLPAKKKLRSERVFNEETGKAKRKLYFESEVKPQGEHLKGAKPLRPVKAVGNSALMFAHTKIHQVEGENVATEAAHKGEIFAEGVTRSALRHHKTAPYRKVAKLEHTVRKKTIDAAYHKALAENPKLKSNVLSRALQKRKIKKDYAKAAREAQKTAQKVKKAGSAVGNAAKALAGIVKRHPMATAVIVLILLLLFCLMSLIGAFGGAGSGGISGLLSVSYLAEDADIDNAELAYTEWETDLQEIIANVESSHSGYDEYRYNISEISHNPFELTAYLTAKYQDFTYAAIQADLQALFNEQYTLTFTPSVETRYADPTDDDEDGDYEPYDWNVLTVTLTARSFTEVAVSHLNAEELQHYALLMQSKGARQYLANPFGDMNWLPYVTSYYGYRIHPISGVKDYHKGVDIGLPTGTPIQSGQDGTVTFAGWSGDYGNVVVIEDDKGLVSKYAHCDTISVTVGQTVKAGNVIATVGNTGASTGSHLHLEVLKNGQYLNALLFADTGSYTAAPVYGYAGLPIGEGSFETLMEAAETVKGMPYRWGGSSPATSFDCSGLVCYLYRVAGIYDFGRIGANSIYNRCDPIPESEAQPGDLVFLHSTYSTSLPITHVAIYVGYIDGVHPYVFHAGNPIGYTRIDTPYWQSHMYGFARIPTE